jgi:hypothetical protein
MSTCPSSKSQLSSKILGVKQDGLISFFPIPLPVTEDFLKHANEKTDALSKFRFTGKCIENSCAQWSNKQCGLIDKMLGELNKSIEAIPNCSIRHTCTWFKQESFEACKVCNQITYKI